MFRNQLIDSPSQNTSFFDINVELGKHAWHPEMTVVEAEAVLQDKPPYTYITRPREGERGFAISFVNLNGTIEHHYFTLIDPKYGIWRNGGPCHIGRIEKVICDMMDCTVFDCRPL